MERISPPEIKEEFGFEQEAERKIVNLKQEAFFTHGTFLPNLSSIIEKGIGLEIKKGEKVVSWTGPRTIDNEDEIKEPLWVSLSFSARKSDFLGRYGIEEPTKYPLHLILDPLEVLKTNLELQRLRSGPPLTYMLSGKLTADQFKNICLGISVNNEDSFLLASDLLKKKEWDWDVNNEEELIKKRSNHYDLEESLLKKYGNKKVESIAVERWLRLKMREWYCDFNFSVPIYNNDSNLIWPELNEKRASSRENKLNQIHQLLESTKKQEISFNGKPDDRILVLNFLLNYYSEPQNESEYHDE